MIDDFYFFGNILNNPQVARVSGLVEKTIGCLINIGRITFGVRIKHCKNNFRLPDKTLKIQQNVR